MELAIVHDTAQPGGSREPNVTVHFVSASFCLEIKVSGLDRFLYLLHYRINTFIRIMCDGIRRYSIHAASLLPARCIMKPEEEAEWTRDGSFVSYQLQPPFARNYIRLKDGRFLNITIDICEACVPLAC